MSDPQKSFPTASRRNSAWQVAPNLWVSFRYAWMGVTYAFATQRNFRIHTVVGAIVVGLAFALHLAPAEIAIVGLTSGAVMALELLNTAMESLVDLAVGQNYHELAKIAKDCTAGAVLISALVAVLVGLLLLLPPLWAIARDVFPEIALP